MRLVITPLAEIYIEEIGDYIAEDNPNRAVSFIIELRSRFRQIALSPKAYRLRHELGDNTHSCAHGNYVIFFSHDGQDVRIERVMHGAHNLSGLLHP